MEAFIEEMLVPLDTPSVPALCLLRRFREYVASLGKQCITITVSSLVRDMIDSYYNEHGESDDDCQDVLMDALRDFVLTRECWFYEAKSAPAVEVSFDIGKPTSTTSIEVDLHYSWNPPVLEFLDLRNSVQESTELIIKPLVSTTRPFSDMSGVDIDYYIGPTGSWLDWNAAQRCFKGHVPRALASAVGAERHDGYTMALELTTTITKYFPDEIRYEIVIRCALPLTIKRRPDSCQEIELTESLKPMLSGISLLASSQQNVKMSASILRYPALPDSSDNKGRSLLTVITPRHSQEFIEIHTAQVVQDENVTKATRCGSTASRDSARFSNNERSQVPEDDDMKELESERSHVFESEIF